MQKTMILGSVLMIIAFSSIENADAVCCFPWDITHYIDPKTGNLVVSGELWNDSYKQEPFGKTDYRFEFIDEQENVLFEKNIILTNNIPINGGAIIPVNVVFPFQVVIEDADKKILQNVNHVRFAGTNSLDYYGWKPADLEVTFENLKKVKTIGAQNNEFFNQWQITGTITNIHSEKTQNVYVVASLHDGDDFFVGVAGYSDEDIHPITLDGHQTKNFTLYGLVPSDQTPSHVTLYAESDDSSMVHSAFMPLILKDTTPHDEKMSDEYKKPIILSADIINTSRGDVDFEWIIQIKKSPRAVSNGDFTKYPESEIIDIKHVPAKAKGQQNVLLDYSWTPQYDGIYFYEYFIWQDSQPLSFPFKGTFLHDSWMIVDSSKDSLKNQLKTGIPFDSLECRYELELVQKTKTGNFVCIKPDSIPKLVSRGWAIESIFYGLTESQITDIQNAKLGCKKTGNQTYCNTMILEKVSFYKQQNKKNSESASDSNSVSKWMIPEELSKIGCSEVMVDHLKQYSNAFDENWYGGGMAIEDVGLPWGVHQYALDQCMQNISELRDSELYGCMEDEVYFRGICMTQETKEKAQSVGEKERED